jgi:hypothetical protein
MPPEEEVIDAESGTLNKNASPFDHLKHLLNIGWDPKTPLLLKFVDKYNLQQELRQLTKNKTDHVD